MTFSPLSYGRGGRTPFRAVMNLQCDLLNYIVACEGSEQRVVPTCVAAGDNEVSCAFGFQQKAFPGSGCL